MVSSAPVHLDGEEGEDVVDDGEEVVEVGVEGYDSSAFGSWNNDLGGVTGLVTPVLVLAADGCGDGVAIRAKSRSFLDFGGDETLPGGAGLSSHFFSASTLLLAADVGDSSSHLLAVEEVRSTSSEDELEAEMLGTMGGGDVLLEVLALVTETVAEGTASCGDVGLGGMCDI